LYGVGRQRLRPTLLCSRRSGRERTLSLHAARRGRTRGKQRSYGEGRNTCPRAMF
jgi:hypothetical protein